MNHRIMNEVRRKIALYIRENDLSFAQFAQLLGISKSYAWELVNGQPDNPKLLTLIKLANVLDITLIELITFEE